MPISAGEMQRLREEERRRGHAHRRLRRERRRRQLIRCLAIAGVVIALVVVAVLACEAIAMSAYLPDWFAQPNTTMALPPSNHHPFGGGSPAINLPAAFGFAGEIVPLGRRDVRRRLEREIRSSLQAPGQVTLWRRRAARRFPYLEGALRRADLPDDLKYVALIESALQPQAVSEADARGLWQLTPETAQRYGLQVSAGGDERDDTELATRAAVAYLTDLHREFGRWSLALAAYNGGETRLRSALHEQGTSTDYDLDLPRETERYVFRAYAAKLILAEPERYGFHLPDGKGYQPPLRDRVHARVHRRLTVLAIAEVSGSFCREVRLLNPAITRDALPPGTYPIYLPEGAAKRFRVDERVPTAPPATARHRLRRGDTPSAIARRYGVHLADLRR